MVHNSWVNLLQLRTLIACGQTWASQLLRQRSTVNFRPSLGEQAPLCYKFHGRQRRQQSLHSRRSPHAWENIIFQRYLINGSCLVQVFRELTSLLRSVSIEQWLWHRIREQIFLHIVLWDRFALIWFTIQRRSCSLCLFGRIRKNASYCDTQN